MSLPWPMRLLILFALIMIAAPASAQVVRVQQQGEAVAGVDDDGEVSWSIQHHFKKGDDGSVEGLRFEPIIDGRRAYYAIRSDLLTVDLDAGEVVERRRFPGVIDAMVPDEDGYKLILFARALRVGQPEADSAIEVRYQPGDPPPGSGLFEAPLILTASDDALAVAGVGRESELESLSAEQTRQAIERLESAEKHDPTNLFLAIYRGRILESGQQDGAPGRAYERAAQIKDAPWSDDLLAAFILIKYDQNSLSEQLAERAEQKMRERGILPERLNGLALQVGLSAALSESLRESIQREDVERMDYLQGRIAQFFPNSEQSMLTWRWVADWMDAQKQTELAQTWRGRAAKASHAPLVSLNVESARKADRANLLLMALLMTLVLIPLGIGLRATERHTSKGWPLPATNIWDGIGLFVVVVGCALLPSNVQKNATVNATMINAPPELFDTTYESPKVLTWLEGLAESEGRDAWVSHAQKAQDALREGSRTQDAPPSEQLLADAISAGPRASSGALSVAPTATRLGDMNPILMAFGASLLGLLMLLEGVIIRKFLPRIAGYLRMGIPGSAKIISALAVPVCALFSAAILALFFDMDRRVRELALPRSGAIFEHGELVDTYLTYPSTWVALLAALLTLHVATIWGEHPE